jgi:hypothetical protein
MTALLGYAIIGATVGPIAFVVVLVFCPDVLKREWWRPKDILHDLGRLVFKVYVVVLVAIGIAAAGAVLYGVVWVLHALWRIT